MRIKKLFKSGILVALIVGIIIIIATNSKVLWKIFGFELCENISKIQVYSIAKNTTKSTIDVKGIANNADGYFVGYTYSIKENNLYIGLKYNKYFGFEKMTKNFNIQVPCRINNIKKVYIVDGNNKKVVAYFGGMK